MLFFQLDIQNNSEQNLFHFLCLVKGCSVPTRQRRFFSILIKAYCNRKDPGSFLNGHQVDTQRKEEEEEEEDEEEKEEEEDEEEKEEEEEEEEEDEEEEDECPDQCYEPNQNENQQNCCDHG